MKSEDDILNCIKDRPGISAKKIVTCMNSKSINSTVTEESTTQVSIYKQLRTLKRSGSVHNRGDRWYVMIPPK